MSYIRFHEVGREYRTGEVVVEALKKVSFEIERGKFTLIVGPSGAGKTPPAGRCLWTAERSVHLMRGS